MPVDPSPAPRRSAPSRDRLEDADPLAVLEVIDRLDVGPVTLTAKKLSLPYRVYRGAREDVHELTVAYDEKVFDPREAADRNLAAMIGAQPALNYGLFCRRVRFLDPLDDVDEKFLRVMMAKTAREIYVARLLQPNAGVDDRWHGLPALLRSDYVRSEVRFRISERIPPLEDGGRVTRLPNRWQVDRRRCAVLSRGETAGLLSHGLVDELTHESHPIFLHSGSRRAAHSRAYPVFRREVPRTARVRTDTDDLQSWMAGALGFARPGALELWNHAIAIFATLPLLRRRRIGRLVTHGLYDGTQRTWYSGIPYYGGRYDSSRQFDRSLSRYFRSKGWGLRQVSLLRPLSEILAEKILCERYPQLSALQLACREPLRRRYELLPCGNCEPCRWTVAVMLAVDADPSTRGFRPAEIPDILARGVEAGAHRERAGVEMVAHLLHEKGWIARSRLGHVNGREHPELLHLRFDADRSLLEEIPVQLRRSLLDVFLDHGEGMLRRADHGWIEVYDDEEPDPSLYFERQRTA